MITRDQLQQILDHDGPNDIWVLNRDGSLSVLPADSDLAPLQDPTTWPKFITRSEAIENFVEAVGWDQTVEFVNRVVAKTVLAKPSRFRLP